MPKGVPWGAPFSVAVETNAPDLGFGSQLGLEYNNQDGQDDRDHIQFTRVVTWERGDGGFRFWPEPSVFIQNRVITAPITPDPIVAYPPSIRVNVNGLPANP